MSFDAALRRSVVLQLDETKQQLGHISRHLVSTIADEIGCSPSTIWGWHRKHQEDEGPVENNRMLHVEELKPHHIEVVYAYGGNIRKAYRDLRKSDPDIAEMSEATFYRRWKDLNPATRAMASEGAYGHMANQPRMLYEALARNDLWHLDAMECPVWVLPAGNRSTAVKPYLISVLDDNTRRIMAAGLVMRRPTAENVAATLADAIRFKTLPNDHTVGGVPDVMHTDNGREFDNNLLKQAAQRLGIQATRTFPYMKHQNGKVERVQRTLQQMYLQPVIGYSQGPETLNRRQPFTEDILHEKQFREIVDTAVVLYNSEHEHSSLDGQSPNQVWCAQENPLREVDPEALRLSMMLETRTYKVQPTGVHFQGRYYFCDEIGPKGLIGRKVSIRYLPSDLSSIELFDGDDWVGTAVPNKNLSPEQRATTARFNQQLYAENQQMLEAAREKRRLAAEEDPDSLLTGGIAAIQNDDLVPDDDEFLRLSDMPPTPTNGTTEGETV